MYLVESDIIKLFSLFIAQIKQGLVHGDGLIDGVFRDLNTISEAQLDKFYITSEHIGNIVVHKSKQECIDYMETWGYDKFLYWGYIDNSIKLKLGALS